MKTVIFYFCLLAVLFTPSCDNNEAIFEPAGGAEYFINNQSSESVKVTFVTSAELAMMTVDTLPSILSESSFLIHTDGIIGVNPRPTDSFSSLRFVRVGDESKVYSITSIDNSEWGILERDLGETGYGLTKYQLVVRDEDFE